MDKKKQRDSNMELLRIIAMLLVMILHTNLISFDGLNVIDTVSQPTFSFLRIGVQTTSFICVNVFILLSGWYGIRARCSRLGEFYFQVLFFLLLSYAGHLLLNNEVFFSWNMLLHLFLLNGYWFVTAYLLLYILSPVLNAFIESASKRQLTVVLVLFYIFQTVYGWLEDGILWFDSGSSAISFIGLYLFGRYMRIYQPNWCKASCRMDIMIFVVLILLQSVMVFISFRWGIGIITKKVFMNLSPLMIVSSMFLLLAFSKIQLQKYWINWIASSCFAAYLLHAAPYNFEMYLPTLYDWYFSHSTISFIVYYVCYILTIFMFAVFIDKLRMVIWKRILHYYN